MTIRPPVILWDCPICGGDNSTRGGLLLDMTVDEDTGRHGYVANCRHCQTYRLIDLKPEAFIDMCYSNVARTSDLRSL